MLIFINISFKSWVEMNVYERNLIKFKELKDYHYY